MTDDSDTLKNYWPLPDPKEFDSLFSLDLGSDLEAQLTSTELFQDAVLYPSTNSTHFDTPSLLMSPDSVNVQQLLPKFEDELPDESLAFMDISSFSSAKFEAPSPVMSPDSVNVQPEASRSPLSYLPSTSSASSSFVARNWPGEFNFTVDFPHHEKNTRSVPWIYSSDKNKLYVKIDHACPINFSVSHTLDKDYSIRAIALYSSVEHAAKAVRRCHNHSHLDEKMNKEHLIKYSSDDSKATYHEDFKTKQLSVLLPYENPPLGQEFTTYVYKFTCFSSCNGGPNRRPMLILFSLERRGEVVGCRIVNIKICACPGRDYVNECTEKKSCALKRKSPEEAIKSEIQSEESNSLMPTKEKWFLYTKDRICWEFLKRMQGCYLNLSPEERSSININFHLGSSDSDSN